MIKEINWSELQLYCFMLVDKLNAKDYDRIIAITRGGLVPAGIISHCLDIRRIETISIKSYTNYKQDEVLQCLHNCSFRKRGDLVIDNIVDTGRTIKLVKMLHPGINIASVYVRQGKQDLVNYFACIIDSDVWLKFPYE